MIIGIDPGKSGGIAFIDEDGGESWAEEMPVCGKEIDGHEIARRIIEVSPDRAVIEKAQAMPKQGVTSMFNYGKGFGVVLGILEGLGIPYRLVTPQAWKKAILSGTAKDKDAAVNYVRRAYPQVNLTPGKKRKPHDGMADAVCIADYGRQ